MTEISTSPSPWQTATVVAVAPETASATTFRLRLERPAAHLAGQHYIIRLTAPDGYTASRSYSVASAPSESPEFDITVERLPGGEVSMFLHDEVVVGDELEARGPIGGWFVWRGDTPALLIGGGSGVVPLMAMLRLARLRGWAERVRLVVSVRTPADLYYPGEIRGPETTIIYTRAVPVGEPRRPGRLQAADLPLSDLDDPAVFICGSSGFADAASELVMAGGIGADRIKVERFGPTG